MRSIAAVEGTMLPRLTTGHVRGLIHAHGIGAGDIGTEIHHGEAEGHPLHSVNAGGIVRSRAQEIEI